MSSNDEYLAQGGLHKFGKTLRALSGWATSVAAGLLLSISVAGGQTIATIAGGGLLAATGPATDVLLNLPRGVAVDGNGNVYIADLFNHRISKLAMATGTISTVAGTGAGDYWGDGGPAIAAALSLPQGIAVDGSNNVYIADTGNDRVRKVTAATGVISTVAGSSTWGFSGDGGPATAATLNTPLGVAVDGGGNIFIADAGNNRVRRVSAATGIISTVAGTGVSGFSGDGGAATSAMLSNPRGLAADGSGNLFIADADNERIRRVVLATGIITTIAGNGSCSFSGDGGLAVSAALCAPWGIATDGSGNLYFADVGNERIRKVAVASGKISTVAGNGVTGRGGEGGPAIKAALDDPIGVAVDRSNNLYIADAANDRILQVTAGKGNLTLQHTDGRTYGWTVDANGLVAMVPLTNLGSSLRVRGMGDVGGGGIDDLVMRNNTAGANLVVYLGKVGNSPNVQGSRALPSAASSWDIAAVGDFDGDGRRDVLWREVAGYNFLYSQINRRTGAVVQSAVSGLGIDWKVAGVADFDGDGKADIFWRNIGGYNGIWYMNGPAVKQTVNVAGLGNDWMLAGIADFNNDGKPDILWRNVNGANGIWLMNANAIQGEVIVPGVSPNWRIVGTGDYNGDGHADILWEQTANGTRVIWFLQAGVYQGEMVLLGTGDIGWQVINPKSNR